MRNVFIITVFSALLLFAACSQPKSPQQPVMAPTTNVTDTNGQDRVYNNSVSNATFTDAKVVTITTYNFGVNMSGAQIKKGDKVKLIVKSTDGTHGIAIPGLNVKTSSIAAGEEKVIEFTADQAGSFDYFCNIPCGSGHRSMKGTLTVAE